MSQDQALWKVRNTNQFLRAVMQHLAGKAHISFEGGESIAGLTALASASEEETSLLQRNTSRPRQQFVVVPLLKDNLQQIWRAIGGTLAQDVLHVQIEKEGRLAFSAFDRFNPGSIVFGPSIEETFIESLMQQGLLERSPQQPF